MSNRSNRPAPVPASTSLSRPNSGHSQRGLPISIHSVSHYFGDNAESKVLNDITLDISAGELVTLIGPSGCGKSTLLNLVAGLDSPIEGDLNLASHKVAGPDPTARIAYMFAKDNLMPWRTALQNVGLGLQLAGDRDWRTKAARWLSRLGLAGYEDSYPSQLSHGMRQRVALARTLILEPSVILMDEPFAALDAQTKILVEDEFLKLWDETRPTVLFVTHDLTEAIMLADRVVVMTARPAGVKHVFHVNFARPRDALETQTEPEFAALKLKLWNALRPEMTQLERPN